MYAVDNIVHIEKPCINSYCYNIYSRKRELSFAVCLMRVKRVDKSTWHVQRSLTYSYAFTKCVQWLHTIVESNKCGESIIGNNHAYIYYIFLQTNYRSQRTKRIKPSIYEGIDKYITVGLTVMHQVRKNVRKVLTFQFISRHPVYLSRESRSCITAVKIAFTCIWI